MKLPLELVPSSCWYSNVRSNVSPGTWIVLQRLTADRAGQRCEICRRQGVAHPVEAHEIWEYVDALHLQRLVGLIALCPDCHAVKHIGRALAQGTHARVLAWFAQVNQLTPAQALAHVRQAFELHARRSQVQWELDLGVLVSRYGLVLGPDGRERALPAA